MVATNPWPLKISCIARRKCIYCNSASTSLDLRCMSTAEYKLPAKVSVLPFSTKIGTLVTFSTTSHFTHVTESPWPFNFKHSHWWKKAESVQVRFTLRLREQQSMWLQDGCKVVMDSYMASNGSCLMVMWTILKTHLLEAVLTQYRETVALRTLTTVGLFYFILSCARTCMNRNSLK